MFLSAFMRKQKEEILMKKKKQNEKKSIEAYACMCFMATCTCGCVGVAGGSATDVQATRHRLMGTSYMKGA